MIKMKRKSHYVKIPLSFLVNNINLNNEHKVDKQKVQKTCKYLTKFTSDDSSQKFSV